MRFRLFAMAALSPLVLSACNNAPAETETADDFAARINGGQAPAAASGSRETAFPDLPKPAANPAAALSQSAIYSQTAADGTKSGLSFKPGNRFELVENGRTITGEYEWLPDRKRIRLKGVDFRPIVLVADGAIYRMTNEDVPLDDVTPDRMFQAGDGPQPAQ